MLKRPNKAPFNQVNIW